MTNAARLLGNALVFFRSNSRSLWLWPVIVLAISWLGDVTSALVLAQEGPAAFTVPPLTGVKFAQMLAAAAAGAVQPWPQISPLWGLVPPMPDPFILIVIGNLFEVAVAVLSAWLAAAYLTRAATALRSKRWLAAAPRVVAPLAGIFLWFRLYGPLVDLAALISNRAPSPIFFLVWQVIAVAFFLPVMFLAYLVILGRLDLREAGRASLSLWLEKAPAASSLLIVGLSLFLFPALVVRVPGAWGLAVSLALTMAATFAKIALGFWLATAWLLFVNAGYKAHPAKSKAS